MVELHFLDFVVKSCLKIRFRVGANIFHIREFNEIIRPCFVAFRSSSNKDLIFHCEEAFLSDHTMEGGGIVSLFLPPH